LQSIFEQVFVSLTTGKLIIKTRKLKEKLKIKLLPPFVYQGTTLDRPQVSSLFANPFFPIINLIKIQTFKQDASAFSKKRKTVFINFCRREKG